MKFDGQIRRSRGGYIQCEVCEVKDKLELQLVNNMEIVENQLSLPAPEEALMRELQVVLRSFFSSLSTTNCRFPTLANNATLSQETSNFAETLF